MKKIRWGLLGAGVLLERWMKGFAQVEDAEIAAVASRTPETAKRVAGRFGIADALTYDEILKRDDIDMMYIPVPHTAHKELAIRAMEAGFPVLVEKPAAVTARDWEEMTACAEKNHVFLMEAVWTRCFPLMQQVLDEIRAGAIGDVRHVEAAFAFRVGDDYQGRLTDPAQAGGALLDVGIYGLHFAKFIYERMPQRILSLAAMDTDGLRLQVDEQNVMIGQYENGAMFTVTSAIRTVMPDTAWIYGTKGYIRMPKFWKPESAEIICDGSVRQLVSPVPQKISGISDEGYQFEIRHVNECLRRGLTESPLVTHAMTKDVLEMCDEIRGQWGLRYPFEDEFKVFTYGNPEAETWLVQMVDDHDLEVIESEVSHIRELTGGQDFCLKAVKVNSWNHDLSPWPAPKAFGDEGFGDGAAETLKKLLETVVPDRKAADRTAPRRVLIGGYSLAGLFALWAGYQTDRFDGIAAASPSVWFPHFTEYMQEHALYADAVYLSLGDKEEKTRNSVMSQVGSMIRKACTLLTDSGKECVLEWNEGNHFKDPDLRTAKAFAWLMNRKDAGV